MEELIRQDFMYVEVIGPVVTEDHYDLVGPNGEITLPQVWKMTVQPDWAIAMHMWPSPDPPKKALDGVYIVNSSPNRLGAARRNYGQYSLHYAVEEDLLRHHQNGSDLHQDAWVGLMWEVEVEKTK
jgi:hypothetical protein